MAILDFLKKLKFPKFEDDFIQDDFEKELEGASGFYGAKIVYDPFKGSEILPDQEDQKEWDKNTDPADPASGVMWINR